MVGIETPGNWKLNPMVFKLICWTVSLALGVHLGQQGAQRLETLAPAVSFAESLTSNPRFAFRPRSIASCSVSAKAVDDGAPVGTLPWN